jgi:predicted dehydrogenase
MESFLELPEAHIVAVCDIEKLHLDEAKGIVDKKYGNSDCAAYHLYEEVLARTDIDAVSLGLPDHWHAIPAIAAARAGKDIYGEKPLAHNWMEGRAICEAVKRYGRIWQTGSWQRSRSQFRFACELVRNGRIGRVEKVEVGLPAGHTDFGKTAGQETFGPPPMTLDYERWLGPAPWAPYCPARVHKNWRWNLDYGGGQLMDWVGHHLDIAHWGMDFDSTGPVEIEGVGEYPRKGVWNTAGKYRIFAKYRNGISMVMAGGYEDIKSGAKWIGDQGWIWVDRSGIDANPKSLLREKIGPREMPLYRSPGHWAEFIECIKTRRAPLAPAETALRSATPGWLGQIAMLTGRKLQWNPDTEKILNDPEASRMLTRPMRSPWHL